MVRVTMLTTGVVVFDVGMMVYACNTRRTHNGDGWRAAPIYIYIFPAPDLRHMYTHVYNIYIYTHTHTYLAPDGVVVEEDLHGAARPAQALLHEVVQGLGREAAGQVLVHVLSLVAFRWGGWLDG